jgi:hypothetical protein
MTIEPSKQKYRSDHTFSLALQLLGFRRSVSHTTIPSKKEHATFPFQHLIGGYGIWQPSLFATPFNHP